MSKTIEQNFLEDAERSFAGYKRLAERALEQVSDEEFFAAIDEGSNPLAVIVKHIAGNLHSRWRDFLTTDGEKMSRNRDTEFELIDDTRDSLMDFWSSGWETLFETFRVLTAEDLAATITIRGEAFTALEAINRQLTHYSYHVGQIVFLAKHLKGSDWQTLSVPRNKSVEFNRFIAENRASGKPRSGHLERAHEFNRSGEN